jgi:hypothetical protein
MSVPARPAAGGVVESGWGQIVHDMAVALDVQTGTASPPVNAGSEASGELRVTFPRPFASPPVVLLTTTNYNYIAGLDGSTPDATGFTFAVRRPGDTRGHGAPTMWLAIGPRA